MKPFLFLEGGNSIPYVIVVAYPNGLEEISNSVYQECKEILIVPIEVVNNPVCLLSYLNKQNSINETTHRFLCGYSKAVLGSSR